jgi:hypothetical protein
METKNCGCLLEEMEFNQHLYNIRSFAKLTGGGVTVVGSNLVHIMEEVLPRKYGGGPADYQLLEEEDDRGQTYLSLVVSPIVGKIDEGSVIATVLGELRRTDSGGKLAAGIWSQAKALQVKRMNPISSAGKVMTLHLAKKEN